MAEKQHNAPTNPKDVSSLELLDPDIAAASPPSSHKKKSRAEIHCEELGTAICNCISTRNWNHWALQHHTADFEAYIEHSDVPFARNLDEYIQAYEVIAEKYPYYRNELIDIDAEVDEKNGTAVMWTLLRIHHDPTHTMKESVTMSYLRRENGKWLFYKQTG